MLNLWRILAVSIVLSLAGCQCDTKVPPAPVPEQKPFKYEKVLNNGLEKLKKDLALIDRLKKRGFDYYKAANIPDLQAEMPVLSAYYREAAKGRIIPSKNDKPAESRSMGDELEKVLKQMNDTFAKKSMSLLKWLLFHLQLGYLFSEDSPNSERFGEERFSSFARYGELDEGQIGAFSLGLFNLSREFPNFVYSQDGTLGLATLNFAFANDMQVIGAPTDKDVMADAQHLTTFAFMVHDINHFAAFHLSPYHSARMRGQLKVVYEQIESQKDPNARLKDHLALFFLSHEFLFNIGTAYLENIRSIFQETGLGQVAKNESFNGAIALEEFEPLLKDILQASYLKNSLYNNLKTICIQFVEKYAPFKVANAKMPIQGPINKSALEKALKEDLPNTQVAANRLRKLGFPVDLGDPDPVKAAQKQISVSLLYRHGLSQRERQEAQIGQVLLSNMRDIADWTLQRSRFDMKFFIHTKLGGYDAEILKLNDTQYKATHFDPSGDQTRSYIVTVTENSNKRAAIEWTTFGIKEKAEFLKDKLPDNLGVNIRAILEALGYNLDDPALPDALMRMIDDFVKSIEAKTSSSENTSGR